ncbi:response regulator [Streptomyces sp. NPDC096097]|uniref:response regulator n=1 Tax=Streptomyces sp. NPDC096097 TaxID=3155546 RepID=UPI00332C7FA7
MTIGVVIADDQEMVRTGFRMILDDVPDTEVVAVAEHRPDVLLLDIRMPELDGLEVTRHLSGTPDPPRIVIVIVTTFDLDEYVHTALHGGASAFLLKDAGPAVLVEAVRAATVGDSLVPPAVTVRLLREAAPHPAAPAFTAGSRPAPIPAAPVFPPGSGPAPNPASPAFEARGPGRSPGKLRRGRPPPRAAGSSRPPGRSGRPGPSLSDLAGHGTGRRGLGRHDPKETA